MKTIGHQDTLDLVATLRLIGPTKNLLAAATRLYLKDAGRKPRKAAPSASPGATMISLQVIGVGPITCSGRSCRNRSAGPQVWFLAASIDLSVRRENEM